MSSCDAQAQPGSAQSSQLPRETLPPNQSVFRAITENIEDLVMLINRESKWQYASPSHAVGVGYTPEELLGKDALCLVHKDDRRAAEQAVRDILRDGRGRLVILRCWHRDGSLRHFECRGAALRNSAGAIESVVVVSRSIDDRILSEEKLRSAHAETESFLQSIPSILIGLDPEGRITHWNATASHVLGLSSTQVLGRMIENCGIKWLHPELGLEVTRWLQTETVHNSDNLAYERNGQIRFLGLTVRPISTPAEGRCRFLIIGADVTERKSLEAQLRQAQKLEAIGQLAAGIAHEINTPTQYVGDNTRFLKESWDAIARVIECARALCQESARGSASNERLQELARLAESSDLEYLLKEVPHAIEQSLEGLQRVSKIVGGMKEFSHPGSEEKHAIDINKAIETTITVARHEWKYVADLVTDFAKDLPLIPCLVGEFNQVMLNLIINASHAVAAAIEEGLTKKGAITITTRRSGIWVEIAIKDSGTGIVPEIQSRIFEPFFTTKAVGKGTGQGLALAHSVIVNRHQGQIWFESEIGKGTAFFVRLPLEDPSPRHE